MHWLNMSKKLKVLIADDSVVYRSQIRSALETVAGVEIVGTASNGRLALDRLSQSSIDLLVLDLEMPEMDGLQTLKELKVRQISCRVLVFSSASKRGAEVTLEALRLGASDFIAKPGPSEVSDSNPSEKIRSLLEPKLRALFPVDEALQGKAPQGPAQYARVIWDLFYPKICVIGSSTGGPTILEKLFTEVTLPLRCPVLITQHMPPIFTAALADRLTKISGIPFKEGQNGELLKPNCGYIAPGNFHMSVTGTVEQPALKVSQEPPVNFVRPAVDPLFESAAKIFKNHCLGLVLTGMGADGQVGAQKIKEMGGAVVIQNEGSCVVFGMPGAVKTVGAFDYEMEPKDLILTLQKKVGAAKVSHLKTASTGS